MNQPLAEALRRFVNNECSKQEAEEVEKWLLMNLTSPDADEVFEQLLADVRVEEDRVRMKRTQQRLNKFIDESIAVRRRAQRRAVRIVTMAMQYAAILVLGIFCIHFYRQSGQTQSWTEVYAAYGETKRVTLPDSSVVWLHADSKIIYPERFGTHTRQIYASGEIYADIAHDVRHPFIVTSNGADIRVLGTRFNLRSYSDNDNVEVTLVEGSVALDVDAADRKQSYTLTPGDVVCIDRTTGKTEQYRFDPEEYTSWKDKRVLYFINRTLGDIVIELQRCFNVPIIVKDRSLLSTRYLATFVNEESLDEIFESLNSDGAMEIVRQDDAIVISAAK